MKQCFYPQQSCGHLTTCGCSFPMKCFYDDSQPVVCITSGTSAISAPTPPDALVAVRAFMSEIKLVDADPEITALVNKHFWDLLPKAALAEGKKE